MWYRWGLDAYVKCEMDFGLVEDFLSNDVICISYMQ